MKPAFLLAILFFLFGCKKENLSVRKHLEGKWELNRRWGPNFDETLPVGNGTLLEFSETGFVRYFRGQQIQAGTYSLSADTTTFNTPKTRITFLANGATHNQLLITSDTAIVFQEYNGNESNLYKRWQ